MFANLFCPPNLLQSDSAVYADHIFYLMNDNSSVYSVQHTLGSHCVIISSQLEVLIW